MRGNNIMSAENIKMSDVFKLPMQQGEHEVYLLDSEDALRGKFETSGEVVYTIHAINAHDANQERIADLDGLRKGSMNCIKQQRQEITEQAEEIKALKAQVELLREDFSFFISQYGCLCGHPSCSKCKDTDDGVKLLLKTPQHCLADVGADAVEKFAAHIGMTGNALSSYTNKLRGKSK